jgi:cytochrome c556
MAAMAGAIVCRFQNGSMRTAVLCLAISLAFALIACGKAEPEPLPPSWDDQSDRNWLYRSQYKTHMRHMWINANRIVSAGRGDEQPAWPEIWASAEDIQRRAALLGGFWRDLDHRAAGMLEAIEDGDNFGAYAEFRALGAACDGCHMATWSPAYMHVTVDVMDGWLKNKPTPHGVEEVDLNPPPAIPNREVMKQLWDAYYLVELRRELWQVEDLRKNLGRMTPEFKQRAELWRQVEQNAARLVMLARDFKRDGMQQAYTAMTNACLSCHAQHAGEAREILIPMPWSS